MRKKTLLLFMLLFAVSLALDACRGCSNDDTPTVTVSVPMATSYLNNCGIQSMQMYVIISERVNGNWEQYTVSTSTIRTDVNPVTVGGIEVPDNGHELKVEVHIVANDCSACCTGTCYQGGYVAYQGVIFYANYADIPGGIVDFENLLVQGCA